MKKIAIHVGLILTFIIIYILQISFFSSFTIAGVMPNIFIILTLCIGLYMGRCMGIIYGIIYGILIDIWIGTNIGITSVCLAIVGFLGGIFDKNFSKDSRMTILLMVIITTIFYEIGVCILRHIILETNVEVIEFVKILLIEVLYNTIITAILYPVIKLIGYEVENEIKGDKILTRYF